MKCTLVSSRILICQNLNDSQTLKSSRCKTVFLQCVCYRCNLLPWIFFVSCDNWKTWFFLKVCRYCNVFANLHIVIFFETSVLKEVRILNYLQNNSAMLMLSFKIEWRYSMLIHTWKTFVADFFYDNVFCILYFLTVRHFSL